jgi:hypothetical protein
MEKLTSTGETATAMFTAARNLAMENMQIDGKCKEIFLKCRQIEVYS